MSPLDSTQLTILSETIRHLAPNVFDPTTMEGTDDELIKAEQVKTEHADLARKYELHGPKIEQIWRSFDENQRAEFYKSRMPIYLKHSRDRALAPPLNNLWKVISELNLCDITQGPNYLLDYLRHRATTPLPQQYAEGVHGGPGDCTIICDSMYDTDLRHVLDFGYCFTCFFDDEHYGLSKKFEIAALDRDVAAKLSHAFEVKALVPQRAGQLVLGRQWTLFILWKRLVEGILDIGSTTESSSPRPQKREKAVISAISNLSIACHQEKLSLLDMMNSALDQKTAMKDYLALCSTEPIVLNEILHAWFYSRPELIPDEKGRVLPMRGDKYNNISIFELIHNIATGVAIWEYLYRLLQILAEQQNDKVVMAILLQEISNVAHLEFHRAQRILKRYAATGEYRKYFRRVSEKYDDGFARVLFKQDPELLTRNNPQLSYIFRLSSPKIDATKAVIWIKKLDDLHCLHPAERDEIYSTVLDAFGDLAIIASFIQILSDTVALPPKNPRRGQIFASRFTILLGELDSLKNEVDLSNFVVPLFKLLKPGMTKGAIDALDQFTTERMGTKIQFLYQDLVDNCISQIQAHCEQQQDRVAKIGKKPPKTFEDPTYETLTPDILIQQRREKNKTRPAEVSTPEITHDKTSSTQVGTPEKAQVFKVNKNTAQVFSTMFTKSDARGSITWAAFEAAMTDLKFSVLPKFGSVYTFFPTENVGAKKSITFHRPHKSEIEGFKLMIFASRLKRVYGWDEGSFEVV